jgi:hypothetical protein
VVLHWKQRLRDRDLLAGLRLAFVLRPPLLHNDEPTLPHSCHDRFSKMDFHQRTFSLGCVNVPSGFFLRGLKSNHFVGI